MLLLACSMLLTGCQPTNEPNSSLNGSTISKENEGNNQGVAQDDNEGSGQKAEESEEKNTQPVTFSQIPAYSGSPYIAINDNEPTFTNEEKSTNSFETYSPLDELGRCGVAYANVGMDLMPTEKRGNISSVKPTGWHSVKYDHVDGKNLYNRCHLIGYQLTAENANDRNLITGTRYLNVEGMLPFENMIADYIKETGNHVLYRVEPIFEGDNLVASGVRMEAYSVEDEGEGISFNVFAYNVQPGVVINYATGESKLGNPEENTKDISVVGNKQDKNNTIAGSSAPKDKEGSAKEETVTQSTETDKASDKKQEKEEETVIRGNSHSKIYHCPGQANYEDMADSKNLVLFRSEQEAINAGYRKAKR